MVTKIRRKGRQMNKLLHGRELCGNTISMRKWNGSFQDKYRNYQASQPLVWKYQGIESDSVEALGLIPITVQTPVGEVGTDLLLTGEANGSLSLFDVGSVGHNFDHGVKWTAEYVFPNILDCQTDCVPKDICKLYGDSLVLSSRITSISTPRNEAWPVGNHASTSQRILITTLGSESLGGSLYTLNLYEPLDFDPSISAVGDLRELVTVRSTVWTADCNSDTSKSAVGTDSGALLIDLETGSSSSLCLGKSDVLSVQFIDLGNLVLCGFRNGLIVTVDVRQRAATSNNTHDIPLNHISTQVRAGRSRVSAKRKKSFSLKGNIVPSCGVCMTSSVSCLTALSLYDQYFLASSMDGMVKLYDHRLIKRGPVQSYEGLVNTHTRIQVGVDPHERFVISGGEDNKIRIWNIKSGKMLFEEKVTNSIPTTVICQGNSCNSPALSKSYSDYSWGAWFGAPEELYWMQFT